jgi:hypothetical protein
MSKSITLVTVETMYHDLARRALEETLKHIDVKEVVVFSDREILPGSTTVLTKPIKSFRDYNEIMLKNMWPFIDTDHILFAQWDAMAYDGTKWSDQFLEYDYIGAVWPWAPEGQNMGNGGFSLRSRKLLLACKDPAIQLHEQRKFIEEDAVQCVDHKQLLESKYGIKFAPTELAQQFSHEIQEGSYEYKPGFGFHGQWNVVKLADLDVVDYFIPRMDYKGWNIHKWHHFLYELGERAEAHHHMPFVMQQITQHSPELVLPVMEWLARHSKFWAAAT